MFRKKGTADRRHLLEGVYLSSLVHGDKTLMGQFELAKGAAIPSHAHPHEQTGFLLSGKLRLKCESEVWEVEAGDSWCISGGLEHAVEVLQDATVIEVFSPVREDFLN